MPDQTHDIAGAVIQAIGEAANTDPQDISLDDHLEEDLYLDPTSIPAIMIRVQELLKTAIPKKVVAEYLTQIRQDPESATIRELVTLLEEELAF